MSRKFSFPDGHWNWPVRLTHQHAVRSGEFIFTGGQVDLDPQGNVQNPNNLTVQCNNAMDYVVILLEELGADSSDLVKLVVFYMGGAEEKSQILELISKKIGTKAKPVINMVNMPELCYPKMVIEIEGVAMRSANGNRMAREHFLFDDMPALPSAYSHAIRCGDMIFTGDISSITSTGKIETPDDLTAQTKIMMTKLCRTLETAGANIKDILKLNLLFDRDVATKDKATSAQIRADFCRDSAPAVTQVPVKKFPVKGQVTQVAVTCAYVGENKNATIEHASPDGHWISPLPYKHGNKFGRVIHIGGQVSLDTTAKVIDPDNMIAQTQRVMNNIKNCLSEFDATLEDVIKVTTFFIGKASADDLHQNLLIRSKSYPNGRGPATTGVPVTNLFYDKSLIEVEVIAIIDSSIY